MKAIIDNKIYDTESANKIYSYLKNVPETRYFLGQEYQTNCWRYADMYKTKKGNYFIHVKQPSEERNNCYCADREEVIELISEEDAKRVLQKLDIQKSIEIFGEVEEG